ncbi:hypothetical protein MKX72_19990 [Priestia sp. FSL R5-0597]|uniref:hypothetical protein n=1 Tax=Priestia sp. FSL R5-0597 TaxID=2921580 RepID=UPI0030F92E15
MKLSFERVTNALFGDFRNKVNQLMSDVEDNFKETTSNTYKAQTDATKAINDSGSAVQKVNNIQKQVDALVVGSNTSPAETVQARVDEGGNSFNTLKEHLDDKGNKIKTLQESQNTTKKAIGYNLEDFPRIILENNDNGRFKRAIDSLGDGDKLVIPNGSYTAHSISVLNKKNNLIVGVGIVKVEQPVETTNSRTSLRYTFNIDSCTNVIFENIRVKGQHFHANGGDNFKQLGFYLKNCIDTVVQNCYVEEIHTAYRTEGCKNARILDSNANKTYTGFFIGGNSQYSKVTNCASYDAHYYPDGDDKAVGYGFLNDTAQYTIFKDCESYRGGSECFRTQGSAEVFTDFINCKSYQSRRYGFTFRLAGKYANFENCTAYDTGDPNYWNGASGSFTYPYQGTHYGFLLEGTGGECTSYNCKVLGTLDATVLLNALYIASPNTKITNAKTRVGVSEAVIMVRPEAVGSIISDSEFTLNNTANAYNIYSSANGVKIQSVKAYGGRTGFLVGGARVKMFNNESLYAGKYAFLVSSANSILDGNISYNCGQLLEANSYAFYMQGPNMVLGTNTVTDDQTTPTIAKALRIDSTCLNFFNGQFLETHTNLGVSKGIASTNDMKTIYGKAGTQTDSTATDVATLKNDFNSLLQNLKNKGLMNS